MDNGTELRERAESVRAAATEVSDKAQRNPLPFAAAGAFAAGWPEQPLSDRDHVL